MSRGNWRREATPLSFNLIGSLKYRRVQFLQAPRLPIVGNHLSAILAGNVA